MFFGDQLPDRLLGSYPNLKSLDDRGDLIPRPWPAGSTTAGDESVDILVPVKFKLYR